MNVAIRFTLLALLVLTQTACEERTISTSSYKQDVITDFRVPIRSSYSAPPYAPVSLIVRVTGQVSQSVTLEVFKRGETPGDHTAIREAIRLEAGQSYANREFRSDYYAPDNLFMAITPGANTSGKLTINWGLQ